MVLVLTKLILLGMGKKAMLILFVGFALSSCFTIHPELQHARSIDKGGRYYSVGAFWWRQRARPILWSRRSL